MYHTKTVDSMTTTIPSPHQANDDSITSSKIIFREIVIEDELIEAFKLRYQEYNNSRMIYWVYQNKNGIIDIDGYDLRSRHFGLFVNDEIIGYMRVIQIHEVKASNIIMKIAKLNSIPLIKPENSFTVEDYYPGAKEALLQLKVSAKKTLKICEPGRLVIRNNYRSLNISKFLIESAISVYSNDFTHAIMTCNVSHFSFYSKYGFNPVVGTKNEKIGCNSPYPLDLSLLLLQLGSDQFTLDSKKYILEWQIFFKENRYLTMDIPAQLITKLKHHA